MKYIFYMLMLCISLHTHAAKSVETLEKELKTLNQSLKQDASKQDTLEHALKKMDTSIAKTSESLRDSNADILEIQRSLQKLTAEQTHAKNELALQKSRLNMQIKSMYLAGQAPVLKMMLNQDDPQTFSRMMAYYRYLNADQQAKIIQLQQQLNHVNTREAQIVKTLTQLKSMQQQQLSQLNTQKSEQSQRNKILSDLNKEIIRKGDQIKVIKTDVAKLNSIVASIDKKPSRAAESLAAYRNTHSWPVDGKLVHGFGASSETATGRHNGVFFSAQEGSAVKAIHDGEVAYADWLRGYGWLMIVDHGNNEMSLYAYNQTLYRKVGDSVNAGDLIARVGKSGAKPDPGLYFELRRYGKAVDPMAWLKKQG